MNFHFHKLDINSTNEQGCNIMNFHKLKFNSNSNTEQGRNIMNFTFTNSISTMSRAAADQGHAHAQYNLAAAHLNGHDAGLEEVWNKTNNNK